MPEAQPALADMAVPERVLRTRRAAALWVDPIYSWWFLFMAATAARHLFRLGWVVELLLFPGVFVVAIVVVATHWRLRAWVGDRRLRYSWPKGAWKRALAMLGAQAGAFAIAFHAWRDPVHPKGILVGAFGLIAPLMLCMALWRSGGALRAASGAYVAVFVWLLAWPPLPEKRYWVGMFMFPVFMVLVTLLSDILFVIEVRAARRAAEADGDTV